MKTKEELEIELQKIIAGTYSDNVLKEDPALYYANEEIIDADLTPEQNHRLHVALKEAENGETYSWDDFLRVTARWR